MATSLAASAATLLSLPPRVRGDVQGCANVSIGRIAWAPATPSFTTPARAAIRLLWWGEHGRGTWLMEGEHASFIIRCARADMIAYLNDMQTMVLDIHDGHDGRSIAESTVDLSLMVSDVLEASLPVISKASAVVGYLSFRLDVSFSDAPSTQLSDPGPIKLLTASDPSSLNSLKSFDDRSKPGEYAKPTKAPGNLQIATSPAPLAENVPGAQKAQMRPSSKPQATVKGRRPQHRKDGNSALQKENIARLLARGRMLRERLESAAIEAPASTSILVNALNEAQPSSDDDADVLFAKLFFEPNGSEAVEAERQKKKLAQAELRRAKDLEAKRQEAAAAVAAAAASEAKQSSTFDVTLATLHLDSAEFPAPHIVAIRVDFEVSGGQIGGRGSAVVAVGRRGQSVFTVGHKASFTFPASVSKSKMRFSVHVDGPRGRRRTVSGSCNLFTAAQTVVVNLNERGRKVGDLELVILRSSPELTPGSPMPCTKTPGHFADASQSDRDNASIPRSSISPGVTPSGPPLSFSKSPSVSMERGVRVAEVRGPPDVDDNMSKSSILPGDLLVFECVVGSATLDLAGLPRCQDTFVSYQMFPDHSRVRTVGSSARLRPVFNHLDHIPRLYSEKLHLFLETAILVLELWTSGANGQALLLGIGKVPLRRCIDALRHYSKEATNDIVHVLSTIAFNGDVDIRDIGTGARVARLGVSVALGSSTQMSLLGDLQRSAPIIQRFARGSAARRRLGIVRRRNKPATPQSEVPSGPLELMEPSRQESSGSPSVLHRRHLFSIAIQYVSGLRLSKDHIAAGRSVSVSYRFPGQSAVTKTDPSPISSDPCVQFNETSIGHVVETLPGTTLQRLLLKSHTRDIVFELCLDDGTILGRTLLPLQCLLSAASPSHQEFHLFVRPSRGLLPAPPPCELHLSLDYTSEALEAADAQPEDDPQSVKVVVEIVAVEGLKAATASMAKRFPRMRSALNTGLNVSAVFRLCDTAGSQLQRETTVIAHTFSPHFRHCEELAIKTNEGCNAFGNLHVDVVHHFTDVSNDAAAVCVASCDVSLSSLPVAGWFPMYQDRAEYRDTPVSTVQLAVRLCSDPPPEQSPRPSPSPAKPVAEEERTIEYVVAEKELETVTTAVPGSYSLVVEVDKLRGIPDNGFYILVFRFRDQVHSSPPQRGYDVHSRVLFPVIQCEDATAHDRVHVEVWSCSDVTSSSPDILLGTAFVDVSSILHHPSMDVPPVIQEIERCEPVVTSLPATLRARVEVDVPRPPPAMNGFQTPLRRTISYRQPARLPRHIDPSLFMTPPSKSPTLFVPLEPVDDRQPGQDGHLVVTCKQAACIASPDALTGMLFVSFALAPRPSSAWQAAQSVTGLVPGSSHPIWAYRISLSTAVLPAPDDLLSRRVEFTLFHRVSGDADKPIGKGSVSIASVVDSGKFADWVDLVDNSSPVGYLYVILAPDPILLDALKHATPSAICPPNEGSPQTKCSNSSSDIIQVESEEDCEDVEVSIEDPVGPLGVPDLIPPASMDDLRKRMRELDAVRSRLDTFDSSAISKPDLTPSCTPLRRRAPTVFTPAPVQVHVEIQTESASVSPRRTLVANSGRTDRADANVSSASIAVDVIVDSSGDAVATIVKHDNGRADTSASLDVTDVLADDGHRSCSPVLPPAATPDPRSPSPCRRDGLQLSDHGSPSLESCQRGARCPTPCLRDIGQLGAQASPVPVCGAESRSPLHRLPGDALPNDEPPLNGADYEAGCRSSSANTRSPSPHGAVVLPLNEQAPHTAPASSLHGCRSPSPSHADAAQLEDRASPEVPDDKPAVTVDWQSKPALADDREAGTMLDDEPSTASCDKGPVLGHLGSNAAAGEWSPGGSGVTDEPVAVAPTSQSGPPSPDPVTSCGSPETKTCFEELCDQSSASSSCQASRASSPSLPLPVSRRLLDCDSEPESQQASLADDNDDDDDCAPIVEKLAAPGPLRFRIASASSSPSPPPLRVPLGLPPRPPRPAPATRDGTATTPATAAEDRARLERIARIFAGKRR